MEKMLEAKEKAKKQVLGDLRMYGIVTGIIMVLFIVAQITNLANFRDIFVKAGTNVVENWIGVILAALFMGYILCSAGVGIKFLFLVLSDKIGSAFLRFLIMIFAGEIVGMILLPLRMIVNAICWVKANSELKKAPKTPDWNQYL